MKDRREKTQLANAPTLELPTGRWRSAVQSFCGESQQFSLSPDLAEGVKALSRHEGVTLFMTLVAAFQVLLHRYSGQDNIVIGTPTTGRSRLELLVLRTDFSGNPSFRELLAQVQEVTLGAYANQDIPFEKLVEALNSQCDSNHNPLFQAMFVLQNTPDENIQLNKITAEFLQIDTGTTKFDLTLELTETPDGLAGRVEYASDLFEAATIDRLISHFQTLLEGIVAHPRARLSELPLLTELERRQLLVEWNDTTVELPDARFIHQLFEKQVERTPQAVAVVYEDQQLTYGELNARANQLARHLRNIGVEPEALVGICVERSLDMVVGLLGILKAGGACVPLDPAYPEERLAYMLKDSAPVALLTQGRFEALFASMTKILPVINLQEVSCPWGNQPDSNLDSDAVGLNPENVAYVIYTSGSTGKPKGTCVLHRGLQNLISWHVNESQLLSNDAVLVVTSYAYVFTQRAIFSALLAGARLVLASEPFDPQAIMALMAKERMSMIYVTQSGLNALVNVNANGYLSKLRRITMAGEPVVPSQLMALSEPRPEIVNNYGATECTGTAIYYRVPPDLERYRNRSIPIGRPIWNARIYILDSHQQLVPVGVAGEIYIGGAPVGRGYLNRPELTAERFVRDPFRAEDDARMYKTGDLGRWLADGTIEYLGRNDFQVKIRGFRIELGEIESALRQHPQLREAVVGVYEPIPGDKRLAAYVVPQGASAPLPSELRDFLRPILPKFMTLSAFVFLDALPLSPNGKLDRKALPVPLDESVTVAYSAPRNEIERELVNIWKDLLGLENIGIQDNFFELGGHSLLAAKMVVEVNKLFNTDLPLSAIYQSPTIEELGIIISSGNRQPTWYSLIPIHMHGSRPPLFAIHTITLQGLPRYMGNDQPLYFIRYGVAAKICNNPVHLPRLEELASHYIKEMQQMQPRGPYYLMGFSFGGMIAYEMACQLVANGHQVNFVGLLDTYLKKEKLSLPFHRYIHKFYRQGPRRLLELVKEKAKALMASNQYGTDFWPRIYTSAPDITCGAGYQPKSYNGRVTLFQGFEWDGFFSYATPEHAWRKLLGDRLEVQQVSGAHFDMCIEPHAEILAAKIRACMDKAINEG